MSLETFSRRRINRIHHQVSPLFEAAITFIQVEGYRVGIAAATILVLYIIYNTGLKVLKERGEELGLEPHVINALKLLLRVAWLIVASTSLLTIFDLPADLFVGTSALLGAALGFGSSQTINNVVAGFYVLLSQPFKVKDYVKIGDLEGQVEEISINYTNLYTPTFNMLKVPNTQVMNSRILNLTHEGYIKYTFTIGFSHNFTESDIIQKVIGPAIKEFCKVCGKDGIRTPEAYLDTASRLEKVYLIRLFIPKGEASDLYRLQPQLMQLIMRNFDILNSGQ
jgi:small-conductance mechanosensitive channel